MSAPFQWREIATEGKPPKAGQYLVFADRCLRFLRTYDPSRDADFDDGITHWAELPPPPSAATAMKNEMNTTTDETIALAKLQANYIKVRAALVKLVGADDLIELSTIEAVIRLSSAPAEDKANTINAIHALRDTLPQ